MENELSGRQLGTLPYKRLTHYWVIYFINSTFKKKLQKFV